MRKILITAAAACFAAVALISFMGSSATWPYGNFGGTEQLRPKSEVPWGGYLVDTFSVRYCRDSNVVDTTATYKFFRRKGGTSNVHYFTWRGKKLYNVRISVPATVSESCDVYVWWNTMYGMNALDSLERRQNAIVLGHQNLADSCIIPFKMDTLFLMPKATLAGTYADDSTRLIKVEMCVSGSTD